MVRAQRALCGRTEHEPELASLRLTNCQPPNKRRTLSGFSLLELLFAMTLTLIIGTIGFQLFRQNERIFQNQSAQTESQQNARAVIFQITDDIRRTGSGVPVYAASLDVAPSEATVSVLNGSDATHLRIREGYSSAETYSALSPSQFDLNTSQNLTVQDASLFVPANGRFVYLWGAGLNSCWSWVRAELSGSFGNTLTIVPGQLGESCRNQANSVYLESTQVITLEEAVSIYQNGASIWRTTATDMSSPALPVWSAASELARDVQALAFTYYDGNGELVQPDSLVKRASIVRIDVTLRTTNGIVMTARGVSRNLGIR
jgi:type II secretory pathway pseudopilin PulG